MTLTPEQYQALANHIRANTAPAVQAALAARNDTLLAELYNADSAFIVWRSFLSADAARSAISNGDGLAQLDNLTVGKRDSLLWAFSGDTNPSNSTQRDALTGLCGTQNALKAAILAAQKRSATQAEAIFASGAGTDANPGLLVWEGTISHSEVSTALNQF